MPDSHTQKPERLRNPETDARQGRVYAFRQGWYNMRSALARTDPEVATIPKPVDVLKPQPEAPVTPVVARTVTPETGGRVVSLAAYRDEADEADRLQRIANAQELATRAREMEQTDGQIPA